MNLRVAIIGLLLLTAAGVRAGDKSARAYFNEGASHYIKGEKEPALEAVNQGLRIFTEDGPLLQLRALIERQQPPQQQPQQDQQKQDQQNDQQKQQGQDQQQKQGQDQKPQESPPQPEPGQEAQDQKNPPESKDQAGRPAEEMTPEEARVLLDALKQQEQSERQQLQVIMGQPMTVEKDW